MNDENIRLELSKTLKPGRFAHTLGVEKAALELSRIHGIDEDMARTAALLHDCAKSMNFSDMLAIINEEGISIDEYEKNTEPILHAPAGSALAKRKYGITGREILDAIRYHTIGCKNPSALTKVIYISDFIEENRKPFPGLQEARELAIKDLDAALILCAGLSNDYVLSQGGKIHPFTLEMINNTEVRS